MSILMVCSCGQELVTEDEHAGRRVRCPICKSIVVIPGVRLAPAGPVAARRDLEPSEEDEDDIRSPREGGLSKRDRLARARIGLGLHWGKSLCFLILSALLLLGALIVLILSFLAATRAGVTADNAAAMGLMSCLLVGLGIVAFFVMPVLGAVGSLMFFWLPQRSGGRVLSMVACGLDTTAFIFMIINLLVIFSTAGSVLRREGLAALEVLITGGGFVVVLAILVFLLLLAGWINHMMMLKNLADYTRYHRTASDVVRMLIIGLVTLLAPALVIFLLSLVLRGVQAGRAGLFIIQFLYIAWYGGLLAVAFKMVNLTTAVRRLL